MNSKEFVEAVKVVAGGNQVGKSVVASLIHPPGRRPNPRVLELGRWLKSMAGNDQALVEETAKRAADQAIYNFLLVLDGLLAIEPVGKKGRLELYYNDGETRILLNDENSEELSVLFKASDQKE